MILDSKPLASFWKPRIKSWMDFKSGKANFNIKDEISSFAVNEGLMIILVTQYTIELYGSTPELEAFKKTLMKFYDVDEVI